MGPGFESLEAHHKTTVPFKENGGFLYPKEIYKNIQLPAVQIRKPGVLYRNSAGLLFSEELKTMSVRQKDLSYEKGKLIV